MRILVCAIGVLALAFGVTACGDDDEEDGAATTTEGASADVVNVEGGEYFFELSATPTTETREITFENVGEEDHDLIVARLAEGVTLDEAFEAEGEQGTAEEVGFSFAKPGKEGRPIEIKKALEPGNYGMVCTLRTEDGESHYDLGMAAEFTIE